MNGKELPQEVRAQLDAYVGDVVPLLEYVLLRVEPDLVKNLPLHKGHWEFRFELQAGDLRRSSLCHTAIGNVELEAMSKKRE